MLKITAELLDVNKKIKDKIIISISSHDPIKWSEVLEKNIPLLPDDIISSGYQEYIDERDGGGYHYFAITRKVEETDQEVCDRLVAEDKMNRMNKKRRYENYLRLKKEFENSQKS